MRTPEADEALRWLAAQGVTPAGPGRWQEDGPAGPEARSGEDLAHDWTTAALADDDLTPIGQIHLGLGLLDLLDEYWVTAELSFYLRDEPDPAVVAAFWDGYRHRLEAGEVSRQVTYSLWVNWFENLDTVARAFAEVLGDDVCRLRDRGRLRELAAGPSHRRAARVLECSGPVRWVLKAEVYEAVAGVPELHPALFRALLTSYHDAFGDLEAAPALALLDRLDLPPGTEHVTSLRTVLRAGAINHYRAPDLWPG